MKAGAENPNRDTILVPAGMNEAWRGFWRHGTNRLAYTSVALQSWWRAGNKSWCTKAKNGHWCSVALQTEIEVRNLSSYIKLY